MKKHGDKRSFGRVRADSGQHRRVLMIAAILGIVAFIPAVLQLYNLMIVQYDYYADLALRNQTRTTQVMADRGWIFDRNMHILATSVGVENVYLDPHELKQSKANLEEIGEALGEILDKDPAWIIEQGKDRTKGYKQIAAQIDEQTAAKIRLFINENQISGIHLEPSAKRYYPYGSLAAQLIGFTNNSGQGSEGIEAAYNSFLEGSSGKVITTKGNNEMDMPFSYEKYVSSQKGCNIILTIDSTVQTILEKQMEDAIARYDVQNGAFGMVMDVNTGEILAMATLGSYDPNAYMEIADEKTKDSLKILRKAYENAPAGSDAYESGKKIYNEALTAAQLKQWRNRCLSDGYEPGSTFKVLTLAAALDCGAVTLETPFYCRGAEQIPGRAQLLHCWRSTGHGAQKTPQALQNSCNLAFAHIGLKIGGQQFYEYIKNFGVLEKTGIDLNGESKGVFFDKNIIVNTDKWGTASLTSAAFGQTFKLTPLQLVRAIASVVNGGYLLEPYVVSEVQDNAGNTVLKQEPTVIRQVIKEETSRMMCGLMQSVVMEGTAKNAQVAGFSIGGKTGTSEKIDVFDANGQRVQDKFVSFVGVAPMDDPQYIVLVALDTPSRSTGIYISGGVMAAPTVGAVMADILPYLGVKHNYTEKDAAGKTVIVEDYTGLAAKEVNALLKQQGITALFRGTEETVTGQIPAAGQSVPGDSQIILYFGDAQAPVDTEVPNFVGMNRSQAAEAAGKAGLYILISGNMSIDPAVVVTSQSESKGTKVLTGTTITLTFADTKVRD